MGLNERRKVKELQDVNFIDNVLLPPPSIWRCAAGDALRLRCRRRAIISDGEIRKVLENGL